jgi:hypothetical protein
MWLSDRIEKSVNFGNEIIVLTRLQPEEYCHSMCLITGCKRRRLQTICSYFPHCTSFSRSRQKESRQQLKCRCLAEGRGRELSTQHSEATPNLPLETLSFLFCLGVPYHWESKNRRNSWKQGGKMGWSESLEYIERSCKKSSWDGPWTGLQGLCERPFVFSKKTLFFWWSQLGSLWAPEGWNSTLVYTYSFKDLEVEAWCFDRGFFHM